MGGQGPDSRTGRLMIKWIEGWAWHQRKGNKAIIFSDQDENKTEELLSRVLLCTKTGICPSWGFSNPLKYYWHVVIVALIPLLLDCMAVILLITKSQLHANDVWHWWRLVDRLQMYMPTWCQWGMYVRVTKAQPRRPICWVLIWGFGRIVLDRTQCEVKPVDL